MLKNAKKKIGVSLVALMLVSTASVFAGEITDSAEARNDVYIAFETISPSGGGWGSTSSTYDTKKWNGDGSVKLSSTTNARRATFRMVSNMGVGGSSLELYPGQGSSLPVGSIRAGQTVRLESKTPISDAGIYGTTCRGSWKSN
ncbi:MAG: hypothetical protein RR539_09180 [Clostridium sp.]|uniref:hypothetical protein n=1 Tax=Clostridium sp. TaxID=1506 RepID=UPI002FC7B298